MTPYREIPLTKGQVALVDACDYELLNGYRWHAFWNKKTRTFYATRNRVAGENPPGVIYMARQILGLGPGDKREADHIEVTHTLDNRRSNLRIAAHYQNQQNQRTPAHNTSGLRGVSFCKRRLKWRAQISVNRKRRSLGYYMTKEEAYAAFCRAAVELHGEFARIA